MVREVKKMIIEPVKIIDPYVKAYEVLKQRDMGTIKMTCGKCGGVLIVSPIIRNAYYKKNGVLQFEVDTINYCKNCSKF
jgi:hypothetical protein